ncbi:Glutamyl-tRNA(Gln) amidotransferase subunit C 2 [Labeo rohita]|uniref:Glutamyl-tRNA(Gln) amidotransferase subunit C 2 n=1 Tax=Labeo rohita TaxID=84645 RepID=A0ABQ8L9N0_LABRO|nr:Glutamyl-tRNA(Gln) amidotransferase subunit C 2 [Labeo rohita]
MQIKIKHQIKQICCHACHVMVNQHHRTINMHFIGQKLKFVCILGKFLYLWKGNFSSININHDDNHNTSF